MTRTCHASGCACGGRYAFCYYAVMMMIMGDSTNPSDGWEVLFMVFCVLLGSTVNATIFANVAGLVTQLTAASSGHQQKMDRIATAMRSLALR